MEVIGISTGLLWQGYGLLYILIAPGIAILALLRVGPMSLVKRCLYAVGLSVTFVIFVGLAANFLLPLLGVSKPIRFLPMSVTLGGATALMYSAAILRSVGGAPAARRSESPTPQTHFAPGLFLLILPPIISVLGALLLSETGDNRVALLAILLIAVVPILISFDRLLLREHYPIALFSVSVALLLHRTLASAHLTGWDIQIEYYYQRLVISEGVWNPLLPSNANAMLSTAILGPVFSIVLYLDLVFVAKLVYPILFSGVPVALFYVFRNRIGEKPAFLAAFFFVSTFVFFTELTQLLRQQIAELFFTLSILVMFDRSMDASVRRMLVVLFGLGIAVSHYGLTYIYLFYGAFAILFGLAFRRKLRDGGKASVTRESESTRVDRLASRFIRSRIGRVVPDRLSAAFLTLLLVFSFTWYTYTSDAQPFISLIHSLSYVYNGLGELFNPATRDPTILWTLGLTSPIGDSIVRQAYLWVQRISQGLIALGVADLVRRGVRARAFDTFDLMVISSAVLIGASILIPYFAASLNMSRIYHISLMFLSPSLVVGGFIVHKTLVQRTRRTKKVFSSRRKAIPLLMVALLLPYFLLNTGFVFEITGSPHNEISLNAGVDYPRFNQQEVQAATWLRVVAPKSAGIFGDDYGRLLLNGFVYGRVGIVWADSSALSADSFVFLRCWNTEKNLIFASLTDPYEYEILSTSQVGAVILPSQDRVYDAGCALIYT
jgi:uncharacterized membrane protein